jgi:hypothetical protein
MQQQAFPGPRPRPAAASRLPTLLMLAPPQPRARLESVHPATRREALLGRGTGLVAAAALPAGSLLLRARGLRFSEASSAAAAAGDGCAPTIA